MPAALNKFVLMLLIAAMPLYSFAAAAVPLCQQDAAAASAHDYARQLGHRHDHDAPAHDHPLTAGDLGSDHCGAGSVFALPAASVGWTGGSTLPRDSFTAVHCFGFVPEQPQRPPLA